jgi:hypothetical protein
LVCFDGCLETKPSKYNLGSEFTKCHQNFDHKETYSPKGLEQAESLPFRVTGVTTCRTSFTGGS